MHTKHYQNPKKTVDQTKKITGDMRRILDFGGNASGGIGRIGGELLHEVDKGETALTELAHDPETVLVDPNVAGAIDGVVERIQSRERAPHLSHTH